MYIRCKLPYEVKYVHFYGKICFEHNAYVSFYSLNFL